MIAKSLIGLQKNPKLDIDFDGISVDSIVTTLYDKECCCSHYKPRYAPIFSHWGYGADSCGKSFINDISRCL